MSALRRQHQRSTALPDLAVGSIANPDLANLTVLIDAFDGGERGREEWPAVFSPRGHFTPRRGDDCVVAKAVGRDRDRWVVVWWDGPIPDPPEATP